MARCPICGRNYADTVRVCSTCGARLAGSNASGTRESVPVQGNGYQQPAAQTPQAQQKPPKKNAGIFMLILSVIFPIVGIICYFSWKKTRPKAAKQVLIAALAALALAVITQIPTKPNTRPMVSTPAPTTPTFSISAHNPTLSPISPSDDAPKLAAGNKAAFDALLASEGLVMEPGFSNSGWYAARLADGIINDIEYAYEGDRIVNMEENLYVDLSKYTAEQIQTLEDTYQVYVDAAESLSCAKASIRYTDKWFIFRSEIWDLDSPENIAAVSNAGLLVTEDGAEYISISLTEEDLLSQGYIKR